MAKTKTPALSLSAIKSIGSELTFQKKGNLTMVRATPSPSDPKTLLQMYQRWEVQDYIAYWQTLSDAQKLVYFRAGARNHRTPVAEFLKEMLTDLPDIVLRYRMDTISAGLTPDSSKNFDHASVLAPSLIDGVIGQGMYFDDVDDWLQAPKAAAIVNGDITLEAFVSPQVSSSRFQTIISKKPDWGGALYNYRWILMWDVAFTEQTCYLQYGTGIAIKTINLGVFSYDPTTWYHLVITHDGANGRFYRDGVLITTKASAFTIAGLNDYYFAIGRQPHANSQRFKGRIDHPAVLNRVLTLDEIYLRSQRHYPL